MSICAPDAGTRMTLELAEHDALRGALSEFPSGVAALSAIVDGAPEIMIASSFQVGISHQPPMVMFSVQRTSTTWPVLARAGRIGVSVLAADHVRVIRQLASRNKAGRLGGVATTAADSGALFLDEASAWLECEITHDYAAGDHRLIVFTVAAVARSAAVPLVVHRSGFHRTFPLTLD